MPENVSTSVPDTPLPVLSNRMIRKFMELNLIQIEPFRADNLGFAAYHLRPHKIRYHRRDEDSLLDYGSILLGPERHYTLQPKEHVVISIEEKIVLGDGVRGVFYPASFCVEEGLIITGGRLDARYSRAIVLGLFNASDEEFKIKHDQQIARIEFGWMGAANIPDYSDKIPGNYVPDVDKLREV